MSKNKDMMAEAWGFLKARKAWWLTPIIITLFLVSFLIVVGQSSSLAPFIYALF